MSRKRRQTDPFPEWEDEELCLDDDGSVFRPAVVESEENEEEEDELLFAD